MASLKEYKKKLKSISNTRKITRTMEMVSAAKAKKTIDRVEASTPYSSKLRELMDSLSGGGSIDHYLVEQPARVERTALLVVTANRGLCGGYNTNVANMAEKWIRDEEAEGRAVDVSMVGKKGVARFRFRKLPVIDTYSHIEDKPTFKDADEIASGFMARFQSGEVQRVLVAVTRYQSAATQKPAMTQLLPIVPPEADAAGSETAAGKTGASKTGASKTTTDFIFEPDPQRIIEDLLPFSVKHALYRLFVEAAAGEQVHRRVAMKLATDNAAEMITYYTGKYNRERQASITQQIMEIVGGAEALD
jgi:F-type H+-transporting ATPase subunit gamma